MDIGIGLPNAVHGTTGKELVGWATAAEEAGFATLGSIDRIVYGNYEPVVALSAAAAVTDRVKLATSVLLGPLRQNPAEVAKQFLSLDALAGGGRAVLGIGLGGREDDYAISDVAMSERGAWMDAAVAEIRRIWDGDGEDAAKTGPRPENGGPTMLVGGGVDATFERAGRYGDGWIMGGGTPDQFTDGNGKLEAAWKDAGRDGTPKTSALSYFGLGDGGKDAASAYLLDYYAWLGDDMAGGIAGSAATDADTVKAYIAGFEAAGCQELIFFPSSSDVKQVALLAEAAGL